MDQQQIREGRQVKSPAQRRPPEWPKHAFVLAVFAIEMLPVYMMVQTSLKTNTTFLASPWLPAPWSELVWRNWSDAARLIAPYMANTLFVAVTGTVASIALSILGAYFFARYRMPFSGLLWAAFLILMLIPGVANIVPLFVLLGNLGLLNTLWALIALGIAGGQVFNIFVLRNFIEELPKDLFEAAEMDGASHLQQIRTIVIPLSGPIIGTLAILSFLGKWNDFLMPLIVLRDRELFTLGVGLIYLDSQYVKDWGHIMAAFLMASLPLFILFLFTMKLFVRGLSSGALKG
jgi:ABC-type glycerol-3-phosphate transport system permease component